VYPLSRGPDPLSTDRYDVIAKVSPDASKEQRMLMLQALLAERFKLVVHRESKELPIYVLVAGKGGPKSRAVEDDGSAPETGSGGGHQIKAHHISMKLLAATLQGWIGDAVVKNAAHNRFFSKNQQWLAKCKEDSGFQLVPRGWKVCRLRDRLLKYCSLFQNACFGFKLRKPKDYAPCTMFRQCEHLAKRRASWIVGLAD